MLSQRSPGIGTMAHGSSMHNRRHSAESRPAQKLHPHSKNGLKRAYSQSYLSRTHPKSNMKHQIQHEQHIKHTDSHTQMPFKRSSSENSGLSSPVSSYPSSPKQAHIKELNWPEYSARKAIVRFRSRRFTRRPEPSQLVQKVLHDQYDIARKEDTRLLDKLMAVFYCWYFGWITDVYNFTSPSRSSFKWILSCVLVSMATALLVVIITTLVFFLLQFIMSVLEAGLWFILTITCISIACLCIIAILNFD